ncbi:MAG: class C sortase [Clostridiales bacterium]|nr:class C sortase [Clostridiales bacterium]
MIFIKRVFLWVLIIIIFVVGLAFVLYSPVAKWLSSKGQEVVVRDYLEEADAVPDEEVEEKITNIMKYNRVLAGLENNTESISTDYGSYIKSLDIMGNGIICVVEIPKINVKLSVYGGTSDESLQKGAGHIEGTSLPVGGLGSNCCISAHRGLANAVMFRDMDKIEIGDEFYIYVLDRTLKYEVDDIRVVLPDDISSIKNVPDKDYVTLITCTPYIINSHRLLVRGSRVNE